MRIIILAGLMMVIHGTLLAADTASVPWEEFKQLYKESIERRIAGQAPRPAQERKAQTHTIDEAIYQLTLGKQSAQGQVLISGRVIAGDPAPIRLFCKELIIQGSYAISGGSLISSTSDSQKVLFLPDGTHKEFQISLSFMVSPREDNRSKIVSFAIPAAIRNSLQLSVPPQYRLLEAPGIADAKGDYHFSLEDSLSIRYLEQGDLTTVSPVEIDVLSRIQPQGRRMIVTTHFVPANPASQPVVLQLQREAQYLSSSLKPSWISKGPDNRFEIRLPAGERSAFSIQFAVDESSTGSTMLQLPTIKDNTGKEGDFVVEEPDDGQIRLSGKGLILRNPVARLGKGLLPFAGKQTTTMHIVAGEAIKLELKRFQPVSAPPIVLDSQYFFTSFEENGSCMSVLVMDIPPEAGPRITLKAVAEAQVWSLKVNGQNRKVYANQDQSWIIPLDEGALSHVELALLCKSAKLGLHGRLETTLPETGLAARNLNVGIALPERVQLISLEGPVSPSSGGSWKMPADFIGKPYLFSRSFHKGEELKMAVTYKEPVKP